MKRLVLLTAAMAVFLAVPAAALAASSSEQTVAASVTSGVLTYTSGAGTVDTVTLSWSFGGVIISERSSPEGSPEGTGCSAMSASSAFCTGATSASIQTLDQADSIVNWSGLPGTIDGGAGDDTVTGGNPAETIVGGEGHDVLKGGGGKDTINAGDGDDRVDVADGAIDTVDCGAGSDTVTADAVDVVTNCEAGAPNSTTGETTPGPAAPDAGPDAAGPLSAPGLLAPVTVAGPVTAAVREGQALTVGAKGVAALVLSCAAEQRSACAGVIFIDPAPTKSKGKQGKKGKRTKRSANALMSRRGRYGSSPFKIRPGSEDKVNVKLTGIALKALGKSRRRKARSARRGRRVRAVVTIAPRKARAQRVTIVLKG